uniref:Cobalt transporter subunit CbtA n=1 Tax=Candidatus Kentrum eta TaxID=2126337 RepID=A0A450US55_9GAMM|nr:MAG: cobalt transporter subunit CbtA [Candidatus Kentron sp. H]VFJ95349.1 MAG: cobalt transporter subunit CbtA [Candidatus Kentron sp. H]VFK01596.1 MAG: cobalt transporter subunit CbtA [Candidatus Kentron sp. H]
MMFATFKKIITTAAITSLIAGVLLTFLQQVQVVPLILEAEKYEHSGQPTAPGALAAHGNTHAPSHEPPNEQEWQPQEGLERNLFTGVANIAVALGFALLLGAAIALRETTPGWRSGLLWGLGGYIAFFVAPALGMSPELPGSHSGELEHRQLWWAATSIATAAGLALAIFNGRYTVKALGAILLILPHLVGAPQPDAHHVGVVPAELLRAFIVATAVTNAAFWLALGGFYGLVHKRLAG